MKKKTKIIVITSVCAAIIAAGGIALHRKNRDRITIDDPQIGELVEENQGGVDVLHLNLTDEFAQNTMYGQVQEQSENTMHKLWRNRDAGRQGFYWGDFTDELICEMEFGWYRMAWGDRCQALFYTDRESGISLPLCPRPNCLHDGSEYCTATSSAYGNATPLYYDGALYRVDATQTRDGIYVNRLCRYEADGSSISELARFGETRMPEGLHTVCPLYATGQPLMHRGWIWMIVPQGEYAQSTEIDLWTGEFLQTARIGFAIWGYELATGKTEKVYETMPTEMGEMYYIPLQLFGDGDSLYFSYGEEYRMRTEGSDWKKSSDLAKSGLYQLSLRTGQATHVTEKECCFVGNGHACYLWYSKDSARVVCGTVLNLETGETTKIGTDIYRLMGDENYLYALEKTDAGECYVQLYRYDGTLVAETLLADHAFAQNLAVYNGTLYLRLKDTLEPDGQLTGFSGKGAGMEARTDSCRVEDIVAGQVHWQTAF